MGRQERQVDVGPGELGVASVPMIVDAVRTPMGRRWRAAGGIHPVELAGTTRPPEWDRPGTIDVIIGCVSQVGNASLRRAVPPFDAGFRTMPSSTTTTQVRVESAGHPRRAGGGETTLVIAGGTVDGERARSIAIPLASSVNARYEPDRCRGHCQELVAARWKTDEYAARRISWPMPAQAMAATEIVAVANGPWAGRRRRDYPSGESRDVKPSFANPP